MNLRGLSYLPFLCFMLENYEIKIDTKSVSVNPSNKTIEGNAFRFMKIGEFDFHRDYYDSKTETGLTDGTTRVAVMEHGFDPIFKTEPIGINTYRKSDEGWLYSLKLNDNKWGELALDALNKGQYSSSSGAMPNHSVREKIKGGNYLKRFIIGETSPVQLAADPNNPPLDIKSFKSRFFNQAEDLDLKFWAWDMRDILAMLYNHLDAPSMWIANAGVSKTLHALGDLAEQGIYSPDIENSETFNSEDYQARYSALQSALKTKFSNEELKEIQGFLLSLKTNKELPMDAKALKEFADSINAKFADFNSKLDSSIVEIKSAVSELKPQEGVTETKSVEELENELNDLKAKNEVLEQENQTLKTKETEKETEPSDVEKLFG